jgi:hypothetical protein
MADHRRKWDRKEYERKALDRIKSLKKEEERKYSKFLIIFLTNFFEVPGNLFLRSRK